MFQFSYVFGFGMFGILPEDASLCAGFPLSQWPLEATTLFSTVIYYCSCSKQRMTPLTTTFRPKQRGREYKLMSREQGGLLSA